MWSRALTCSTDRFQIVTSTGDLVSSEDGSSFEKSGVGYVSRMAVTESCEVVIEATPDEIMDVLFDLESLTEWSSAHHKVEILERDDQGRPSKSRQVVKIVGVSDEQVLAYTVLDDGVSWTLVSAKRRRTQDARYTLTSDGDFTRVRFELTVDLLVPLPGFVIKKGAKGLMDTATQGLRKRVLEVKKGHP
jgi:hypothetical protein